MEGGERKHALLPLAWLLDGESMRLCKGEAASEAASQKPQRNSGSPTNRNREGRLAETSLDAASSMDAKGSRSSVTA